MGGILVEAIAPWQSTVILCSLYVSLECKEEKVVIAGRFLVLYLGEKDWRPLYVDVVAVGAVFVG